MFIPRKHQYIGGSNGVFAVRWVDGDWVGPWEIYFITTA